MNNAPPPTDKYSCNAQTGSCSLDPTGVYATLAYCTANCVAPPPTDKYTCDAQTGSCSLDPDGDYATLAYCTANCVPYYYDCDSLSGRCLARPDGQYTNLDECHADCKRNPNRRKYSCNSQTKSCTLDPAGVYDTLEVCQDECKNTNNCDSHNYLVNCRDVVRNTVRGKLPPGWKPLPWNAASCSQRCPHYFQKGSDPYVGYDCSTEEITQWCNCDNIKAEDAEFAPNYCLWKFHPGSDGYPGTGSCVAYDPKNPKSNKDFTGQRNVQLCMTVPKCADTYCNELWSQQKCNFRDDRTCLNMMTCLTKNTQEKESQSVKTCFQQAGGTPGTQPSQYTKDLYQCLKENRCISENPPPKFRCVKGNCVYDATSDKTFQQCLQDCV